MSTDSINLNYATKSGLYLLAIKRGLGICYFQPKYHPAMINKHLQANLTRASEGWIA